MSEKRNNPRHGKCLNTYVLGRWWFRFYEEFVRLPAYRVLSATARNVLDDWLLQYFRASTFDQEHIVFGYTWGHCRIDISATKFYQARDEVVASGWFRVSEKQAGRLFGETQYEPSTAFGAFHPESMPIEHPLRKRFLTRWRRALKTEETKRRRIEGDRERRVKIRRDQGQQSGGNTVAKKLREQRTEDTATVARKLCELKAVERTRRSQKVVCSIESPCLGAFPTRKETLSATVAHYPLCAHW